MSFQLYSDIHIELSKNLFPRIPISAKYLILAGDIGKITMVNFKEFIKYCSSNWEKVFFVFGNHEFYGSRSIDHLKGQFRTFFDDFENVILLDSEYYILDNLVIYGFTCWTKSPYTVASIAKQYLNDYKQIKTTRGNLTPDYVNALVERELEKFREFIIKVNNDEIECNSVMIITHFPPIRDGTSNPLYLDRGNSHPINMYFAWNNYLLDNDIICSKIKIWMSGHTHWCYDFILDNIRYLSNQIGYSDEDTRFTNVTFDI